VVVENWCLKRTAKSKRRKSKELRKTRGFPELTHTTTTSLRSAGKRDAVKIFSEALETAPTRELSIRKAWAAHAKNSLVPYTPEEALSLSIEAHLIKNQYIKFRSQAHMKNCKLYQSYHVIHVAKEECFLLKMKHLFRNL